MKDWHSKSWKKGTRVEVYDADMNKLGNGKLINDYIPPEEDVTWDEISDKLNDVTKIEMDNGDIIEGWDCWWIPVEITKQNKLNEYTINIAAKGFDNFSMEVKVYGTDLDEAVAKACLEPRYNKEDPYVLMAESEGELEIYCSFAKMNDALKYCETITSGKWVLVEKIDNANGVILKQSE